ncbi:MAG: hypothetical protein HY243_01750 [Proteobacteria bacterium]|nr:hypothetical protein [Pseudomonadota bacterium]
MSFLTSGMGWYWMVVPFAVAAFGVLFVLSGFGHVFGGRAGRGGLNLIIGTPLAVIGLALSLLALNTQTMARLAYEGYVADVSIKAVDPANKLYDVTVARHDGANVTQTCRIQGDEWEMSGRVQKWKPWANMLGLDSTYDLDQLGNKYFTAAVGNGKAITACDLKGPPPLVNQYVPSNWLFWITSKSYTEERRFGSASYMPLADGATYKVVMTQSGLNAEPSNDAATAANNARP